MTVDNRFTMPVAKRRVDMAGSDFYSTPAWATHALIDNEDFFGKIWESACGDGAMSEVLKTQYCPVYSSDLVRRGYGMQYDFLNTPKDLSIENLITNPPFNLAEEFLSVALKVTSGKIALLLRLAFLEGVNRQKSIFNINPPTRVWVFSERITFYPKGATVAGSGTTAYAWFVWDMTNIGKTELKWLPVGYKEKYKS